MIIQTWAFSRHVLENEWSELVKPRKTDSIFLPTIKFELSSENQDEPDSFPIPRLGDEISDNINKCGIMNWTVSTFGRSA